MTIVGWLFESPGEALAILLSALPEGFAWQAEAFAALAISFLATFAAAGWLIVRRPGAFSNRLGGFRAAALFALGCGAGSLAGIAAAFVLGRGLDHLTPALTLSAGLAAVAIFWPILPRLTRTPSSELADANMRLREEVAAHEATLRELEGIRRDLEDLVAERTRELTLVRARFETALRGANVHVYSQDRDLRYTWAYVPSGVHAAAEMLGRTDEDILPASEKDAVIAVKQRVLATGNPENCEISYVMPAGRALFSVHIEPAFAADGSIEGITCAAIDISQLRSLESEQRRLAYELRTALQRYEIALRGSHVTVFTQDRDFRYTSISNPAFGLTVEEIVGRTEDEILPAASREPIKALKQAVLDSGQAQGGEVSIASESGERWYDLHIEPLPDITGSIAGLTCAAVDVTERKASEAHLRLLMRELTHRSKNLLAVIQAMARQTARHAETTESFLERFNARLQALATSHDLLIQEGWYGASMHDLARRQLALHLDGNAGRVSIDGPVLLLKPVAAQSLGLALHELTTNAEKYGALSVPEGRVSVTWSRLPPGPDAAEGVELIWTETAGPTVRTPGKRGFGSLVVEKNLARALDAKVDLTFCKSGVRCRIAIPESHLVAPR